MRRQPSLLLIMLAGGMLVFGYFGWLRVMQVVAQWELLLVLEVSLPPMVAVLGGIAWGIGGMVTAAGLWMGWKFAPALCRAAVVAGAVGYWLERALFTRSPAGWVNLPFSIGFTLLWIWFTFVVLALPQQRVWFSKGGETHEGV
ncbi:MAG: hypothetical protein U1B80_03935 [Anaerolineaceae bacterium]|nr:hypothetical protein [Anaerolineaceae bacterium]